MAARAVRGVARQFDDLLADQGGFADQRRSDTLALQLFENPRAFLFIDIDEDRVRRRRLDLGDIGGEVGLSRFGRQISYDL